MARAARLARPAQRWFNRELEYLAQRSPSAALALVERLEAARYRLAEYPESGPPARIPGFRRLVVAPYVLVYRQRGSFIEIVSIRHGRQADPDEHASNASQQIDDT